MEIIIISLDTSRPAQFYNMLPSHGLDVDFGMSIGFSFCTVFFIRDYSLWAAAATWR